MKWLQWNTWSHFLSISAQFWGRLMPGVTVSKIWNSWIFLNVVEPLYRLCKNLDVNMKEVLASTVPCNWRCVHNILQHFIYMAKHLRSLTSAHSSAQRVIGQDFKRNLICSCILNVFVCSSEQCTKWKEVRNISYSLFYIHNSVYTF
jgi:hypothetical protein